ncbi:hypothetical protein PF005_g17755 [Phytophthora fragariae]|uniref:Protein kinase domain-containing protein n=1 Tax=Phytophthora fragariae TaxID=53985 RepID=A0A6A3F4D7_9STRA|nr:hypothetical protein PF009_g10087 [Phytophthora fragariae]KAE9116116.1 hypothetical protein PF010_g9083 [Phytophthora fragariae]KAE9116450.1 hypothetical protein PF007_g9659 [Phytophthora fragariae]KAE9194267.1 hypothetical protein PF005_g17755 [Phytophthora fragariae]KAE9236739.1 hypothetical protein PF004_g8778 [Phytophthora fragariae]
MGKRWSELRINNIELFVSEVDKSLTLLQPTETENLLTLLHRELQSSRYTTSQLEIIHKACDEACSNHSETVFRALPEWFIGWCELENEVAIARGGYGEVSKAKWLNSDVIVKRVIFDADRKNRGEQRRVFEHEVALWFSEAATSERRSSSVKKPRTVS